MRWNPKPRNKPCQWDTCEATGETFGHAKNLPEVNWVNADAITAMQYGVEKFGPQLWNDSAPDLAVTGIDFGTNLDISNAWSTTGFLAAWPVNKHGIPTIAFSAVHPEREDFNDWLPDWKKAEHGHIVFTELANRVVEEIIGSGKPYLPDGVYLNVNFPKIREQCQTADKFRFIITRVHMKLPSHRDELWCGKKKLLSELDILDYNDAFFGMPCTVTITPVDARDRTTVNQHWKQRVVMDKLMGIVECPHKLWGESWTAQNKKGEDWRDYIGERRPASEPCWHVPKGEDRENCFKRRPTE